MPGKQSAHGAVRQGEERGNQKFTSYVKPMLAKLHKAPFDNKHWVYEIKWDGYRAVAEISKKETRLYSRNGLSFKADYPAIYNELQKIKKVAVLDGEIVALDAEGKPVFQLLQQYGQGGTIPICYYVFDCLSVGGKSIEDKPLLERKKILKSILPENDLVKYCDHVEGRGIAFFEAVKEHGLEGVIAKRANSVYIQAARSQDWLKLKNVLMEEAVIAGYTAPGGIRLFFGALVLGQYKNGKLIYIGHTGTGFSDKTLKDVYLQMQKLKTGVVPFDTKVPVNGAVTWLKPKLVCNLKYSEITQDGIRRHPVFMGLRIDKAAEEVKVEPLNP